MVFIVGGSLLYFTAMVIMYKKCMRSYLHRRTIESNININEGRIENLENELKVLQKEVKDFKKEANNKLRNRFKTLKRKINSVEKVAKKSIKNVEYGTSAFDYNFEDNPFKDLDVTNFPSFELDPSSFQLEPEIEQKTDDEGLFRFNFEPTDLEVKGVAINAEDVE
jgi:uncharacterized protein (UPF0335 family)